MPLARYNLTSYPAQSPAAQTQAVGRTRPERYHMATSFGQAWVFAIKFCHDYGIQMTDQQMHDFCNLLIEFRDGSRPTTLAVDERNVSEKVDTSVAFGG